MRVLLIEEGWHATMYLATALENAGHAVTVLTANGTTAACPRRTQRWISGPVIGDPQFLPHLDRLAREADRIIPLTETAMAALWAAGWSDRIFPRTEPWQRHLLGSKHALVEHMGARGIAVPRQRALSDSAALPIVVKGSIGCAGKRVRICETRAELREAIDGARRLGGDWVLQEFLAGPTFLVGGVFDRGAAVRIYAAEKLEQHPPRTGGAIVLRSIADPDLLAIGTATLRELAWTGFASVDVMRGADGRYVLLEVNPRMWGSLAGAISAGVDLFTPFAALLAGETPAPDLAFAAGDECMIFPRYLNAASHRNFAGARQALRDLRGPQGKDWLDPRFVVHILRRLYWMKRRSTEALGPPPGYDRT